MPRVTAGKTVALGDVYVTRQQKAVLDYLVKQGVYGTYGRDVLLSLFNERIRQMITSGEIPKPEEILDAQRERSSS